MTDIRIVPVARLDLAFAPKPWAFADERRAEIDATFAAMRRENPALWNGRVLMLHRYAFAEGVFSGEYLETDYAAFAVWARWGRPAAGVYDCFAAAAIVASDGPFLLGVMGPRTLNAGSVYCPSGTPDPTDIVDGRVDLDVSVRRELKEETGLNISDFTVEPGWTTVFGMSLIAHLKVMHSRDNAETLRGRILDYLANEREPELSGIEIVRGPADVTTAMPQVIAAFLAHRFALR
jgi:8-oxo-dGTP pyrophosphatase MutT (NUDIX family)